MKKLVETIACSLVDHPEDVVVLENESSSGILLELHVNPDDMGRVIGKRGRIAKAIRSVVNAAAAKEDKQVTLDIR